MAWAWAWAWSIGWLLFLVFAWELVCQCTGDALFLLILGVRSTPAIRSSLEVLGDDVALFGAYGARCVGEFIAEKRGEVGEDE